MLLTDNSRNRCPNAQLLQWRSAKTDRPRQRWDDQGNAPSFVTSFSPRTPEAKKEKSFSGPVHDDDNFGCTGKQGPGFLLESGDGGTACLTRLPFILVFSLPPSATVRCLVAPVDSDRQQVPATPDEHQFDTGAAVRAHHPVLEGMARSADFKGNARHTCIGHSCQLPQTLICLESPAVWRSKAT